MAREANTDIWVRAVQASPPAGLSVQDSQCSFSSRPLIWPVVLSAKRVCRQRPRPALHFVCPTCDKQVLVPGRLGVFCCTITSAKVRWERSIARRRIAGTRSGLKLVRIGQADAPESRERLKREACAAGKLNHPRVAQVYSLNFSEGHPYLVMELVSGLDFAKKFEREGPINERVALRMALDVAEGLSALHLENLVHGDQTGQHRSRPATATPSWLISAFRHDPS
jgi:serine/threonine protein kinase